MTRHIAHGGSGPTGTWHSEFRLRISWGILSSCAPSNSRSLEPHVKARPLRTALVLSAFSLLGALGLQAPAAAHLGGDADSVSADRDALHAQLRSTPMGQYELHEISTASGTVVHEYMTPQGKVFALTWQGSLPPNLRQLFGNYYQQFQAGAAAQARTGMHRLLSIAQPDLVVQSMGRLRDFRGKAYVPSLVPAGVAVADLQ
jgi:Protein of unknown function (DUF2844)